MNYILSLDMQLNHHLHGILTLPISYSQMAKTCMDSWLYSRYYMIYEEAMYRMMRISLLNGHGRKLVGLQPIPIPIPCLGHCF